MLLHPTSLPSRQGVGDLGRERTGSWTFWRRGGSGGGRCCRSGRRGGPGYSPYSSESAFAGSPWLVSPERLVEDGLLEREVRSQRQQSEGERGSVDYARAIREREPRLRKAFETFVKRVPGDEEFREFCDENKGWLEDTRSSRH